MIHIKSSLVITLVMATALVCCKATARDKNKGEVMAIQLKSSMPTYGVSKQLVNSETIITVFYYRDLILHQIPIIKTYTKTTLDKEGNVLEEKLERAKIIYKYFMYKEGTKYGIMYDTLSAKAEKRALVDSILQLNTLTSLGPFLKGTDSTRILIATDQQRNKVILEKYIPKVKYDESYSDSTFLYYTRNFSDVPFSFSNELDNEKKMKLFKIRIIYNKNDNALSYFGKQQKEVSFSFEKIEVINKEEVLGLFTKLQTLL